MTLDQLNALDRAAFTAQLGGIFEHSPWVAERAWPQRPFASLDALHAAMSAVVAQASSAEQFALIRAHPELAGKAALRGELTDDSRREQHGAGLDQCSAEEYARLHQLNSDYSTKFGFPFIIAVRGHDRSSIIAQMAARLGNTRAAELAEALRQIERIAQIRLQAMTA
ncbi:2-oxo-4-hydroxy-4-carboxy-5-ureidoimidazoline decarboxylase [Tahibacter aquaticus]|uniref:2-oxo-4-hydroxy-4-carboxy-5-ureidoimidazoline decarboxylase n=1 Tax=Tahibacter aquaticus TaxID=520092 RepID=A0A4R6YN21_9GAMM|nr:2-oxo-4-hydroxy-4-carboxy-5-ureidoimidazoline decarboxylase [Tahibacter aquaticus]TDR38717.1 2-oxo-4-hydroxy-4-carboxy-5-ureidoimidazoline decarboxylase [Tahibacter aquaticus]